MGCESGAKSCLLDWPFPFQSPIHAPGNAVADPSYRYGATQDGAREPHHGIDLPNTFGTPVYAAGDGTVVMAGSDTETPVSPWRNFYGNVVVLEHHVPGIDEPVYTLYGHLSKVDATSGQTVKAGQKIGEVGLSGVAVGSHLHFEVRVGQDDYASTRNPELWLLPGEPGLSSTSGILAVRVARKDGSLMPLPLSIEYFVDRTAEPTQIFPVEAYQTREKYPVNPDDILGENYVLGNLPPGNYRVTFVYWGTLYERWVDLSPGKLTFVPFEVP
jgi:murein DD-endopeptidase MepM/ murein hydrolase activator NlpD